jgi:F0F1-type ATP synthase membrane subunit c/vacuolar-type H+-ATPase subunit K
MDDFASNLFILLLVCAGLPALLTLLALIVGALFTFKE